MQAIRFSRGTDPVYTCLTMKNSRLVGILCLSATILLFSTFEVVSKLLSPRMGPVQITFSRFLIGGILLLPLAIWRLRKRTLPWTWRQTGGVCLLGFVNIVVSMGLVQLGQDYDD